MALPHVNAGELITSAAWNNMVDEFNTKLNKAGDIMTGRLTIPGANWDPLTTEGDLKIGDNTNWFKIGVATGGGGAGHVRLYQGGTNKVMFLSTGSNNELTLANGNVGVGTTSPAALLDVAGGTRTRSLTFTTANNAGNSISISRSANTMDVGMGTSGFLLPNSPPLTYTFRVGHYGLLVLGGGDSFVTKLSVDQSGLLTVNGPVHAANSDIYFTKTNHTHTGFGNTEGFAAIENASNYGALMILGRQVGPSRIVKLWDSLEVVGTAFKPGGGPWAVSSDKKLKKNIKDIEGALDKLTKLRGVTFDWKDESTMGTKGTQIGMIAQEVEPIFPAWVISDHNGNKGIAFSGFEALVVESLKELKEEITKIKEHLKI